MKLLEHFKELSLYPNNAEELKGLILQLAVQGKLTAKWREAHPNVEPASELLKRIEAEKQQLIAEKKIKKEKPLPPVGEDEIPFELPQGWAWSRFDEVILLQMGQSPPSISYNDEGIGEILINGPVEFSNGDHGITKEIKYTSAPTKMCNKGDLIVCIRASIGRTNIASNRACIGRGVASITSFIEFNYIHNYILINKATLFDLGTGTTFRSVSKDPIRNMLIPVPPLEEQKAIVEVVNTLFKEVEQLESLTKERVQLKESFVVSALARLTEAGNTQKEWNFLQQHFSSFLTEKKNIKSLKETILQLAVQGKLTESWRANNPKKELASELLKQIEAEKQQLIAEKRIKKEKSFPPIEDDDIPFELPNNWMWFRWVDLLGLVKYPMKRGPFGSALRKDFFVEEGVKVFEQYNAINNDPDWCRYRITNEKYEELKAFTAESGDMLISCSGTLGRICILPEGTEIGIINQALLKIRLENRIIDNEFFIKLFRSYYLQSLVYKSAMGSAITNMVGVKELKQFLMPIPPLEEQKVIVEKVNSLTALCDELEQQIETSQTQIKLLMQSCLKEVFEHESN